MTRNIVNIRGMPSQVFKPGDSRAADPRLLLRSAFAGPAFANGVRTRQVPPLHGLSREGKKSCKHVGKMTDYYSREPCDRRAGSGVIPQRVMTDFIVR